MKPVSFWLFNCFINRYGTLWYAIIAISICGNDQFANECNGKVDCSSIDDELLCTGNLRCRIDEFRYLLVTAWSACTLWCTHGWIMIYLFEGVISPNACHWFIYVMAEWTAWEGLMKQAAVSLTNSYWPLIEACQYCVKVIGNMT